MNRKIRFAVIVFIVIGAIYLLLFQGGSVKFSRDNIESVVFIPPDLSRGEMAEVIGEELEWGKKEKQAFSSILAQMQWLAFGSQIASAASSEFNWSEEEKETFLISTSKYLHPSLDPLEGLYVSDTYIFSPGKKTVPLIAGEIVSKLEEKYGEEVDLFVEEVLSKDKLLLINDIIRRDQELLPDLSPLPPQDLVFAEEGGKKILRFSTIYYNHGKGPLELRADPNTAGIREDIERDVLQRIYHPDGSYRDSVVGNFMWHQQHLHYHFSDFATYHLEAVSSGNVSGLDDINMKSTFCIRDVSRVDIDVKYKTDAKYLICGKELQGISVGWADTYFYNYADQILDLTNIPSGRYRLVFTINPAQRFDEYSIDNNISSAVLDLDMENLTVKVIEESPKKYPEVEHVYPEQDCSNCVL